MGAEVPGDSLGDEWKGYVFRITGGNDKQGFPMKQGVMHPTRVRLLLSTGHSCYRPRRTGERRRKSVRGCIVGMDLAVLALSIVKQGEGEIPGITDTVLPKRLGPKRANKIRKMFGLTKEDDVSSLLLMRGVFSLCTFLVHQRTSNTDEVNHYRSANSSSAAKSNPKARVKNHTPKHLGSSVSSLHSVSNTSVISWLSSAVVSRHRKRQRYVFSPWYFLDFDASTDDVPVLTYRSTVRVRRIVAQARGRGEGEEGRRAEAKSVVNAKVVEASLTFVH